MSRAIAKSGVGEVTSAGRFAGFQQAFEREPSVYIVFKARLRRLIE
ncbi:MAG TPA: hypothetical protein VJJ98_10425 [Sedimentisphaerales bacterium]|nr:hypothetical protein [Sedimentisphaerales bacterium]